MNWFRRGVLFLLSLMLLYFLLSAVSSWGIKNTVSNPDKIKAWLADSQLYDHLVSAGLEQAQKSGQNTSGTVSFQDTEVQKAAQQAFTPQLLQTSFNTFIDSNYKWLNGQTAAPDFKISLAAAKQQFADQVGQYVTARLTALPVCTPQQLAQIPIPADPLTIACRPSLLDPKTEGARVTQEINDDNDVIKNPEITAQTLGQEGDQPDKQPYNQKFSKAPQVYKSILRAPWIFSGLAVLTAIGIVFLASSRRRGWKLVGIVLTIAGVLLIVIKLVASMLLGRLETKAKQATSSDQLEQPINYLLHKVEPALIDHYLWAGLGFLIIATAIFVWLRRSKSAGSKPAAQKLEPITPAPEFDESSSEPPLKDASGSRLAPKRGRQPGDSPTPKSRPNKKPASRKRPRLVQ